MSISRLSLLAFFTYLLSTSWSPCSNAFADTVKDGEEQSAEEQCGDDRRCRIERLRLKGQKRRARVTQLKEQKALDEQEFIKRREIYETPREAFPWAVDLVSIVNSQFYSVGISGSWQLMSHVRLWANILSIGIDSYGLAGEFYSSGNPGYGTQVGVHYLFSREEFSTYIGAQATFINIEGELSGSSSADYDLDFFDIADYNYEFGELEAHLVGLCAGATFQSKRRYRIGLGVTTHFVLFASHRDVATRANLSTRSAAPALVSQALNVVIDLSAGYAF